ncbi:hypothetical protein BRC81_09505 [Halobacteriales archaeon QS_1_68_20]|nr:MAG: hypothetical protein BRC81_09505 [Halobacteriales archaeon QS_1_68_20]
MTTYEPLGYVAIPGTTEAVVGDRSEYAYVCVQDGFAVVDVRDPTDPTVAAENRSVVDDHEDGPMTGILDVRVDGDLLVVPGPGNDREGDLSGVALYDVSDPTDPALTAFFQTDHSIHDAYFVGDLLYVVDGRGMAVYDVTEPAELGRWTPAAHDDRWAEVHGLLSFAHDGRRRVEPAVAGDHRGPSLDGSDEGGHQHHATQHGPSRGSAVHVLVRRGREDPRRQRPGTSRTARLVARPPEVVVLDGPVRHRRVLRGQQSHPGTLHPRRRAVRVPQPGEQRDPPPLTHEPTPEPTATPSGSPTPTETPSPTPTPTESLTPTPTESPTPSDATPTGTEATSPGVGPLATLGGLALGIERLRRRRG